MIPKIALLVPLLLCLMVDEGYAAKEGVVQNFWDDSKYILTSASRIEKKNTLPIAIFSVAAGLTLTFDPELRETVSNNTGEEHPEAKNTLDHFERFGNGLYLLPVYALAYTGGWLFDNTRLKKTGVMAIESYLITGIITNTVKYLSGRQRAHKNKGAYDIYGPTLDIGSQSASFPSGHTASAFATAAVLSEQYDNIYLSVGSYTLASLVGVQRVFADAHWGSDVLVGAVIGYLIGKTVVKQHKKRADEHLVLLPVINKEKQYVGLTVRYLF